MELAEIIAELETYTGKFPRLALERAIEEREAITPLLLAEIEKWKDNLEKLLELPDYHLPIYALYLLAQFKESKACPVIIEFFSVPGEISLDITGDLVTEDLKRILASVSDGNIEPIKQLIENKQANEYVRGAALQSLMVLVAQDVISREVVIEYFRELFSTRLEKEYSYLWTDLVVNSARISPCELNQQIKEAFDAGLIDVFSIDQKGANHFIKQWQQVTLDELRNQHDHSLIEDTIAEMKDWACFRVKEVKTTHPKPQRVGKLDLPAQATQIQGTKKAQKTKPKKARPKNRPKE